MLRSGVGILSSFSVATEVKCGQNAFALEFVRWRRKPRWLPVAKSKQNIVRELKKQDPEERAELMRLHNNYKTQMRSLMQYFREEVKRIEETSTADHIVLSPEQQEAEFQRCVDANEEWNKKIYEERNLRLEKERQEHAAFIRERLELAKLREEEHLEKIEAIVRREKELAKTFITLENLDDAVNAALANPVDYNFSIDLKSNIYRGRNTIPSNDGGSGVKSKSPKEENKELLEAKN